MSYPIDLEEYSTQALVEELERRMRREETGRCPYCMTPVLPTDGDKSCRCKFGRQLRAYHDRVWIRKLYVWTLPEGR